MAWHTNSTKWNTLPQVWGRKQRFMLCILIFMSFSLLINRHNFYVSGLTVAPLPVFGIGSILFPVRGSTVEYVSEIYDKYEKRELIEDISIFFVDSFWTGKVGGGTRSLTKKQQQNLQQSQIAEFTKRYGSTSNSYRLAELIACRDKDQIIGCAGVEVDKIPNDNLKGPILTNGPLMSNLAISRKYRRRGIAEKLVQAVEDMVRKEWGYEECYLYVEERNIPAIKLYTKLGYTTLWKDETAKTLLPTSDGNLQSAATTIVCMKKKLTGGNNLFSKLFFR